MQNLVELRFRNTNKLNRKTYFPKFCTSPSAGTLATMSEKMNEEATYFEISDSGDLIRIEILGLSHPNAEMDWDKNWVKAIVEVKAGVFSGKFKADFMTVDFVSFKNELAKLYDKLN